MTTDTLFVHYIDTPEGSYIHKRFLTREAAERSLAFDLKSRDALTSVLAESVNIVEVKRSDV